MAMESIGTGASGQPIYKFDFKIAGESMENLKKTFEALAKAVNSVKIPHMIIPDDFKLKPEITYFFDKYYSVQEITRWPYLKKCSLCETVRDETFDPWGKIKECQNCGHIDPVPIDFKMRGFGVETITWPEVQVLLIAMLRQVPDGKLIIDKEDFMVSDCTLFQETDENGRVFIWFEQNTEPLICPWSETDFKCNLPAGHEGAHTVVTPPTDTIPTDEVDPLDLPW